MINLTAFEDINPRTKQFAFVGSKTALLQFSKDLSWENLKETYESAKIIQMIPFSSKQKMMGVIVYLHSNCYHFFLRHSFHYQGPNVYLLDIFD